MAHWREMVSADNPNLHFWDIEEHSPVTVTIEKFGTKEVKSAEGTANLMFLWFAKAKKPLGLNVTNGEIIERVLKTSDPNEWVGKKITLRVADCRGEQCIRIDAPSGTKLPKQCPKFKYTDSKESVE